MSASNFSFLRQRWHDAHEAALKAEQYARRDPRTSGFWSRRTLELIARWIYRRERNGLESAADLHSLLSAPTFVRAVGPEARDAGTYVREHGNAAVHQPAPFGVDMATDTVEHLHSFFRLCRNDYGFRKTGLSQTFDVSVLTGTPDPEPATRDALKKMELEIAERDRLIEELNREVARLRTRVDPAELEERDRQISALRQQIQDVNRRLGLTPTQARREGIRMMAAMESTAQLLGKLEPGQLPGASSDDRI